MKKTVRVITALIIAVLLFTATMPSSVIANTRPAKVKRVMTSANIKNKTIKLSWKKVKGATKYAIYKNTKKKFKKIKPVYTKKLRYTFRKLKRGTRYYFKIVALQNKKTLKNVYTSVKVDKINKYGFSQKYSIINEQIPYYGYNDVSYLNKKQQKRFYDNIYVTDTSPNFLVSDYNGGICINGVLGFSRWDKTKKTLKIPETINGKPVIKIGPKVTFEDDYDGWKETDYYEYFFLSWLEDNPSVLMFGDLEDYPLDSVVKTVVIPSTVKEISAESTVWYCENIKVSKDNPYYSAKDGILYNKDKTILLAVPDCYKEKEIIVADGTQQILPNALEHSLDYNYEVNTNRKPQILKIPATVTQYINAEHGPSATSLSAIEVDENNPAFCSIDGVLYSKDMKILYCYPPHKQNKSFVLPETVVSISDSVFENTKHLEELTIGKNLVELNLTQDQLKYDWWVSSCLGSVKKLYGYDETAAARLYNITKDSGVEFIELPT